MTLWEQIEVQNLIQGHCDMWKGPGIDGNDLYHTVRWLGTLTKVF